MLAAGVVSVAAVGAESDWFVPLGPPPQAAPRRISGGESFPPLPLPATPLRRSERKRDPSPPMLLAKAIWGESATFTYDNGATTQVTDWNLCPGDLQQLMRKASPALGVEYGSDSVNLTSFEGDPLKNPVLVFSGVRTIKFDRKDLELLRAYVLRGGMVVADSIAGSPYFYQSFRKAMEAAFPESSLHQIPLDHPLYHMVVDVGEVHYPRPTESNRPVLEGIYVYSRIGVLISKHGLGCGWDGHEVPLLPQATFYDVESATRIGMNLVAYAVGYSRVGREQAKPEFYGALDEKHPSDEFVFAQLKHAGAWNVHSGGVSTLLQQLRQRTSLRVSLKRVPVDPAKDGLAAFTFLYLTGLDDFTWDSAAVGALKRFLGGGGTLLINNGLGLRTFDRAVRRELRKVLPDSADLRPIPIEHPIFSAVARSTQAQYTPAVLAERPGLQTPLLEGVTLGSDLKIIYSPYDLELGWQGLEQPLAKGYESSSAMALGLNIVLYAMTH
jgi:hypothetical protein